MFLYSIGENSLEWHEPVDNKINFIWGELFFFISSNFYRGIEIYSGFVLLGLPLDIITIILSAFLTTFVSTRKVWLSSNFLTAIECHSQSDLQLAKSNWFSISLSWVFPPQRGYHFVFSYRMSFFDNRILYSRKPEILRSNIPHSTL